MKVFLLTFLLIMGSSQQSMITCTEMVADPKQVRMYWKNELGNPIQNVSMLFEHDPKLTFACNGGMYTPRFEPLGLYIEDGKQLRSIKRVKGDYYNFGMKPQGVFLITKDYKAKVTQINDSILKTKNILYATQSSPILVFDSNISPILSKSRSALKRNGVGLLKDGRVLLAVSEYPCTFQEFAQYFLSRGCVSAMMLDAGVSCSATRLTKDFCNYDFGPFIGVY